jgi:N-acetylglucosaminyl-diphospho-decaprenol L-rhamnosyltransferase
MARSLAIVLVHYHTPDLAARAVAALTADLDGAGLAAEGYVVDNGSDEAGRRRLDELPFRRLGAGANLGYAGGVNLGVAAARADFLLLMNPDVIVEPGCVPALVEALERGAAVAGPRFFWDGGSRLELPPPERRGYLDAGLAALAPRHERWARRARRRWRRHARRHWQARDPLASYALSGSLLAVRRDAWERLGPFDAGFQLYFEETEWLLRAERQRLPSLFVPAARAVHLHAQSAFAEPRAERWFEESAERFRILRYGRRYSRLLERWGRPEPSDRPPRLAGLPELPVSGLAVPASSGGLWVEVSPNAAGFPAAAERLPAGGSGSWSLPAEIAARLPPSVLRVALVDERGRERATYRLACGGEG